jgi:hypothetical protein
LTRFKRLYFHSGQEPSLPPLVFLISHTLHCASHSAVFAGLVTGVAWRFKPVLLIPLLGWWSHIVIDVFTHSADYYPSPVLYPITERGFDGMAWITPWFMVLNYLALGLVGLLLLRSRKPRASHASNALERWRTWLHFKPHWTSPTWVRGRRPPFMTDPRWPMGPVTEGQYWGFFWNNLVAKVSESTMQSN